MNRPLLAFFLAFLLPACGAPSGRPPPPSSAPPVATPPAPAPAVIAPAAAPVALAPAPVPASGSGLAWELIAVPSTLTMAQRGSFLLRVIATNGGNAVEHPIEHGMAFTVAGESSMLLDFAFSNGLSPMTWSDLPPGASEESARAVGETLFEAPGDYEIAATIDGVPHMVTVHVTR